MNIKKLGLSIFALAVAFAMTAGTTLAFMPKPDRHSYSKKDSVPEVKVESKNTTHLKSEVKSEAETGDNKIVIGSDKKKETQPRKNYRNDYNKPDKSEADIDTGKAESYAGAEIYVGDNYTEAEAPYKGKVYVKNDNYSYVDSYVKSEAETGENAIYSYGGEAEIETGNADSGASAFIVIGSNVTKIE
ncbi:MAG: hypothetical protein QG620_636 [Patescibacteria group bacterium]|nr:hypothetical protein [Patescibacteria group bacterium]